ncbi:MAG: hypothetical protein L0210_04930 [Rhodospirillales bacterium]|nr:hypothetical protein [Rhodospirillales bacterium]
MNRPVDKDLREIERRRKAPLATRTGLGAAATQDVADQDQDASVFARI